MQLLRLVNRKKPLWGSLERLTDWHIVALLIYYLLPLINADLRVLAQEAFMRFQIQKTALPKPPPSFWTLTVYLVQMPAGGDPHDFITVEANGNVIDSASYDAVGRIGFGDLEIDSDLSHLYTINLLTRELYKIPLGNDPSNPIAPTMASQVTITDWNAWTNQNKHPTGLLALILLIGW